MVAMKLFIWMGVSRPVGKGKKRPQLTFDDMLIVVMADTLETAVATVRASYLAEYGVKCPPWILDKPERIIEPSDFAAFFMDYGN